MSQASVDFTGLRNLTVNGSVPPIAVPPGTYGDFTANGSSGFSLGVAGATQPAVYNLQRLTLNGSSRLEVLGPVIVTLSNGVAVNGTVGTASNPEWLTLRVAFGDVTLNGNVSLYGYVHAPSGTITLNGSSKLIGGTLSDRLILNGSSVLRLINQGPSAVLTSPNTETIQTAPIAALTLRAAANDMDGLVTRIEFFAGAVKVGEATAAPYEFKWTDIAPGTYSLMAKATDNAGQSAFSRAVTLIANAPPSVDFFAPKNDTVIAASGTLILVAAATDGDGTVSKVEFFQNGAKVGEANSAPYQLTIPQLAAGTYTFTARATDNHGASADSPPSTVISNTLPSAVVTAPQVVNRGAVITLTANAADSDGTVSRVEFYRNGTLLGTVVTTSGEPPAFVFADSSALLPGAYEYTVRAYDNHGLYSDSTVSVTSVLATLPYTTDFELQEGYAVGAAGGQLGWSATSGRATVTADVAYNGLHSVALAPATPSVSLSQAFAPLPDAGIVFMDFFARPVAGADVSNATMFDVEGARFAFVLDGAIASLRALDGNGNGGGTWRSSAFAANVGPERELLSWTRLTARLDFGRLKWDLYAGGNMVAADLGFRDNAATHLGSFAVRGDSSSMSRLDYVFAGADNPLFDDTNDNGIDDVWETAHGRSLTGNGRDEDPDGDGLPDLREYIGGTDPSDYYNGQAPVITSTSGSNQTSLPGSFNPEPFSLTLFDAVAQRPLANAPVVFTVTQGSGGLASNPGAGLAASSVTIRTGSTGTASVFFRHSPAAEPSTVTANAGRTATIFETTSVPANAAPTIAITSPVEGAMLGTTSPISVSAVGADLDGSIVSVEFFANESKIGEATSAPYAISWSPVAGEYSLKATATDNAGAQTTSLPVKVAVAAGLEIAIETPSNYTLLPHGTAAELTISLGGSVAQISRVEYYANDSKIGEAVASPFAFTWRDVTAGSYMLIARAIDISGTSVVSAPVFVGVGRAPLYLVSFEAPEGYVTGDISGQGGWVVDSGAATVGVSTSAAGANALVVQPASRVSREFGIAQTDPVYFFDFLCRPSVGVTVNDSTLVSVGQAFVSFSMSGDAGEVLVGEVTDGLSFRTTGYRFPIGSGVAAEWMRVTLRVDYAASSFDLFVNGRMVYANLANWTYGLGRIDVNNGGALSAQIDALSFRTDNPLHLDQDGDGIDDAYERANGMDPLSDDRAGDLDEDSLTNVQEYVTGTWANRSDSDGDALPDGWELSFGFDPTLAESGSILGGDSDMDGLTVLQEAASGTNPSSADTDGDGLPDGIEVKNGLDPMAYDAWDDNDGDSVPNAEEVQRGTDPNDYYDGALPTLTPLVAQGEFGPDQTLSLKVTDRHGNVLANAPVTFSATLGGHKLAASPEDDGQDAVEVRSDGEGVATVYVKSAVK